MISLILFLLQQILTYCHYINVNELISIADSKKFEKDLEKDAIILLDAYQEMKSDPEEGIKNIHKYLFCSFLKWSNNSKAIFFNNINSTPDYIQWIGIVYNSNGYSQIQIEQEITSLFPRKNISVLISPSKSEFPIHHRTICSYYSQTYLSHLKFDVCEPLFENISSQYNSFLYSKASLVYLLLPILPNYEYIWILDGDMVIDAQFDVKKFLLIHQCSFLQVPIIIQPLIRENTQFYRYLQRDGWNKYGYLSSEVGFVEIQVPMFDSKFLQWYLLAFVTPMLELVHILGADWGFDELFCPSAREYIIHGKDPTNYLYHQPACTVAISNISIHHKNMNEIGITIGHHIKLELNYCLMRIVRRLFPSYAQNGLLSHTNPFNPGTTFQRKSSLLSNCSLFGYTLYNEN